jgi:hypothetical protein
MKLLLAVLFLTAASVNAQTISPLHASCGKKCSNTFEVRNDNLVPIFFQIETTKVVFEDGKPHNLPLTNEKLWLSQSSGRLGPRETRKIDFKMECTDSKTCVVAMKVMMTNGVKNADGLVVRLILPYSIYACPTGKVESCRLDTLKAAGVMPAENRK